MKDTKPCYGNIYFTLRFLVSWSAKDDDARGHAQRDGWANDIQYIRFRPLTRCAMFCWGCGQMNRRLDQLKGGREGRG